MKHCVIALCLVLFGCTKEPTEHYAAYTASCFSCAVEGHDDGGRVFRDTLNGHIAPDGDTVPTTWKANFMIANGEPVYIRACSLLPDSVRFPVVVNVLNNWVNGDVVNTSKGLPCAEVSGMFHQ